MSDFAMTKSRDSITKSEGVAVAVAVAVAPPRPAPRLQHLMIVTMMQVRVVRMAVHDRCVHVPVTVRFTTGRVGAVIVQVFRVVTVPVGVSQRGMLVLVLVILG